MSFRLGERGALFAVSALLALVPFFVVTFPPITDLPQHLAQIRLLGEALADPAGPYRIQWWTPYSLPYALLALCRAIAPPLWAGRLAVALIALLWVATAHLLAARRGRSATAAVLASLFVFCNVIYWGFLSFAIGWPAFAAWMHLTSREVRRPRQVLYLAVIGLVLYACHALWLLAGIVWIGVVTLADLVQTQLRREPLQSLLRPVLWRTLALVPAATALALWAPGFQAGDERAPPGWNIDPLTRITRPGWYIDALLGGLRGPMEWLFLAVVAAWLILGAIQHRASLREAVDGRLLLAAVLLGLFALVLPDKYMHTMQFSQRWMPFAAMLLLLAMPTPRLLPALLSIAVVGIAGMFVTATAVKWIAFERDELTGLTAALEQLPARSRVLGLDYWPKSTFVRHRPFLQTYAWAQVLKGGTLNFSFASFSTSLVVFRSDQPPPWTPRLNWFPRRLRPTDLDHFDYVIVNGTPEDHEQVVTGNIVWRRLAPVTTTGRWRLYRVKQGG